MSKKTDLVFTQTRMNTFLECERKEWFQFQAGGNGVGPAAKEDYYIEGEFGHYVLKHWYQTGKASKGERPLMLRDNMLKRIKATMDDMPNLQKEKADDLQRKLTAMIGACHAYKAVYRDDFKRFEILAVEEPFEIEIGGFKFAGRIDLAVRDVDTKTDGFMEHKFLQAFSLENFTNLPLNLQQLVYSLGFEKITGKLPSWYRWNIVKKSQLRRKGMEPKKGEVVAHPESLVEFESRVQGQYIEDTEKMFFRPPPRRVEAEALKHVQEDIAQHIESWKRVNEGGKMPPMRWCSCEGRYNTGCVFGEACTAAMAGHKEGWNAPECQGLYRKKEVLHPELEDKED